MEQSKFVRRYNIVQKAWANWLEATANLFFSLFIKEITLTEEDCEMQEELWLVITKVVNTGPGPVNIPAVPNSHVGNKTLYFKVNDQWFLAIPNLEIVLITEPNGNKSNVIGVQKHPDLAFQRRLLSDLKVWLEAFYEAEEGARVHNLYVAKHTG